MANFRNHQSSNTTKMLFLGDSGAGKSGALASLAAAGYNLRILDLDNGLDVLKNLLIDPAGLYGKDAIDKVDWVTLTDPMKPVAGKLIPTKATVWNRAVSLLQSWKDGDSDLGSILTWGPNDVLVIDSLTMLSNAALAFVLSMNSRLGQQAHQSDWFQGQQLIESLCQMLYDVNVKCNVIVNCHLTYIGPDGGIQRAYPNALGKALPPKIGRYFNSALLAETVGTGTTQQRRIHTTSKGLVELKNTAPSKVAPFYPLATGLADYFKAVRSS